MLRYIDCLAKRRPKAQPQRRPCLWRHIYRYFIRCTTITPVQKRCGTMDWKSRTSVYHREWKEADGTLTPIPDRHTPTPEIILQVIRCYCKSGLQRSSVHLQKKRNRLFYFWNARSNLRNKVLIVELSCIEDAVQNTTLKILILGGNGLSTRLGFYFVFRMGWFLLTFIVLIWSP